VVLVNFYLKKVSLDIISKEGNENVNFPLITRYSCHINMEFMNLRYERLWGHPASYPMGTRGSFPVGKVAKA
jgi:hypothetical protein